MSVHHKKSAHLLSKIIAEAELEILPDCYHGDLSLNHPDEYAQKIEMAAKEKQFHSILQLFERLRSFLRSFFPE